MSRKFFAGVAAIALTLGLGVSADAANNPPKIGLVQIDLSNPFHLGEVEGAKEAARRAGFDLIVTSGEGDVNKQIQAVENLINQGVDAISVNFIDAGAFGPTMAKAKAAGIPIICLHSKPEGCAATLGFDERYTGKIVGEYSVELLKAKYGDVKGKVANLQGLLGQGLNTDRSGGFTDVMAKYPGVQVVAQEPTSWDPTKAVSITENWMTAYPDLDLIYGNSDSLTVPAAGVVERAGKKDQIMLVSVDGTKDGLEAVKNGTLKSTVLLAPQYSGFWKAYFPYLVATKKNNTTDVLIQGVLVTADNVDASMKLADDLTGKIQTFPYEKPLKDIVATYK
ncbi:MAG TPA: sugar ABC transporter substrate-binding protein [Bauldia sp.]|nr:sugar ABC transporter substrate-binding protein [Bauldia sp.]